MSFEGYYQILCGNGHLAEDDVYYYQQEGDHWKCRVCGEAEVWHNLVDVTNGSYYGNERVDGWVELEADREAVYSTCSMGHQHLASPVTYKIPTKQGTSSIPDRHLTTIHLKIELDVEHPAHINPYDAMQKIVSEGYHDFDISDIESDGISITDTKIICSEVVKNESTSS